MTLEAAQLVAFAGATDLARARDFYGGVLGLPLESEDDFACVFRSGGTRLRVTRVDEAVPAPYTMLGWAVPDIEAAIGELSARGVEFLRYERMAQDDLGTWSAPSGARVAWFKDPDGNTLSIQQMPGNH
jgi:catechol 2,3-dioxygenase-like lactoylglutathione lyase family enzyme